MPKVGGKKFNYTKKGVEKAKKVAAKTGMKMQMEEHMMPEKHKKMRKK